MLDHKVVKEFCRRTLEESSTTLSARELHDRAPREMKWRTNPFRKCLELLVKEGEADRFRISVNGKRNHVVYGIGCKPTKTEVRRRNSWGVSGER